MKTNLYPFLILSITLITNTFTLRAQTIYRDVNCSAGEVLTNGNLSIGFVLGEVVGEMLQSSNEPKHLTVGFLQPDIEIKEILERDITKSMVVYPNPIRSGLIKLAFKNIPADTYKIELTDLMGRVLQTQDIVYNQEDFLYLNMDVSALAKGMYFIRIKSRTDFLERVKLIKI